MRENQINEISRKSSIIRKDLIEKDALIHEILSDLSKDKFFSKNFVFKGGTCLVKTYLGYYRFSEDMDFTWKHQEYFHGLGSKGLRSNLSEKIDQTGRIFEDICERRNLEFRCKKEDNNFVELGGSNKTCTFKIWNESEILGTKNFIKVQINFVENILYPIQNQKLKSLVPSPDEELRLLLEDHKEYFESIDFETYDINEILCEKIRAMLTRKGTKARDFLDAYLICNRFDIELPEIEDNAVKKLQLSLKMYEKYGDNLKEKVKLAKSGEMFDWGEEKSLLLEDMDEKEFYSFVKTLQGFLLKIIERNFNS